MIRLISHLAATMRTRRSARRSASGTEPGTAAGASCIICGSREFKEGPNGRRSRTGKLPACASCGSLERHRIVRAVWRSLAGAELRRMRGLQFSPDPSVNAQWFDSFEVSDHGKRNSLDLEHIDRPSASHDVVICNHVLEHVEHDRRAFREIMRILKPGGFLQFTVPNPRVKAVTNEWGYPDPNRHDHYRVYGRDLVQRFGEARPGVQFLHVRAWDDVTGVADLVYFASVDSATMGRIRTQLPDRLWPIIERPGRDGPPPVE